MGKPDKNLSRQKKKNPGLERLKFINLNIIFLFYKTLLAFYLLIFKTIFFKY